jgi:hypothetical protein
VGAERYEVIVMDLGAKDDLVGLSDPDFPDRASEGAA